DPINGTNKPKAIPGALVTYLFIILAPADTQVDAGTLVVTDPVPDNMSLFVNDLPEQPGTSPVAFLESSSGLSVTFTSLADMGDDVDFSDDGGVTWTYVPVPNAIGLDSAVTHVRIRPQGTFNPSGNVWIG